MENKATSQINGMAAYIKDQATNKARDIKNKGQEEFDLEVAKIVAEGTSKIQQVHDTRCKKADTDFAKKKSRAINKQRLEKIKARQEVMKQIGEDVKKKLAEQIKGDAASKTIVTKLIVQGLLMLLENEVTVTCRESDKALVQSCLADAQSQYSKIIIENTKANKTCKCLLNDKLYLPKDKLGGVTLSCSDGKISIDNTLDLRLSLVMEQAKPAIRSSLFPNRG